MSSDATDILSHAIAAVTASSGINIEQGPLEHPLDAARADAILTVRAREDARELFALVKERVTGALVAQLALRLASNPGQWILVTRHVSPALALKMRAARLQFIDAAGNAFLDLPPSYIYIQGNSLPDHLNVRSAEKRPLNAAGVKAVFPLLCDPSLVQAPVRAVARAGDVAVGTVSAVLAELTTRGHLVERGRARHLVRRVELFYLWVEAFGARLRPKLLLGRYESRGEKLSPRTRLAKRGGLWGGESAASRLIDYLKPQIETIYARRPLAPLCVALKLIEDQHGHVEIRQRFWNAAAGESPGEMVHPILVYADLVATESARNLETATAIYHEHIEGYLSED
jgi:hypothetical protein